MNEKDSQELDALARIVTTDYRTAEQLAGVVKGTETRLAALFSGEATEADEDLKALRLAASEAVLHADKLKKRLAEVSRRIAVQRATR